MLGLAFVRAIPWQVWGIGGFLAVVGFVVLGYFNSQAEIIRVTQATVLEQQKTISKLEEQIAASIIDKNNLILSNKSYESYIATLQSSIERVIAETQAIIQSDAEYEAKINAMEKAIADKVRNDRIEAIRNGRKSELLLNYINKNVECYIENFDKYNGTCIQGVWRENE